MRICEAHAAGGEGLPDQGTDAVVVTAEGEAATCGRTKGMTTICGTAPCWKPGCIAATGK